MLADLKVLMDIQELDREVIELNGQIARYPVIWEDIKARLAKRKAGVGAAADNKDRHQKERKRVEQKIRLFMDDLRRFQSQQSTVKTAREYEALNKQVEGVKAKLTQLEEQAIQLMEKDEPLEKEVTGAEEELKKVEAFYIEEKTRIRGQFNEKKGRVAELEAERQSLLTRVEPEILAVYERINRRHPGSGVVGVRAGSCTGCHFQLLPNVLVDVHKGEKLTCCPNCDRILSADEDFVPQEAGAASSGEMH